MNCYSPYSSVLIYFIHSLRISLSIQIWQILQLSAWWAVNNLALTTTMTRNILLEFKKNRAAPSPLCGQGKHLPEHHDFWPFLVCQHHRTPPSWRHRTSARSCRWPSTTAPKGVSWPTASWCGSHTASRQTRRGSREWKYYIYIIFIYKHLYIGTYKQFSWYLT